MASVQMSGKECAAVTAAAQMCVHDGDMDRAYILDKLARKMMAAQMLAREGKGHEFARGRSAPLSWKAIMSPIGIQNPLD
jgi:hypothetical protein